MSDTRPSSKGMYGRLIGLEIAVITVLDMLKEAGVVNNSQIVKRFTELVPELEASLGDVRDDIPDILVPIKRIGKMYSDFEEGKSDEE